MNKKTTIYKYILKLNLTILLLNFGVSPCFSQYDSLAYNGDYRTFLLHLPSDYDPANPTSLIIAMHGGFGSGPQLENQSQLSVKADSAGFIVVYPEGVKGPFGIRAWNAGACCGYAQKNNIDDVGFISNLIDTLIAHYAVDSLRIYATGMSNGAFMSYRLACELSSKITAIAPVAGSMATDSCYPEREVPVIHFHSYRDSNIPYQGGVGSGVAKHYNPPLDSVMNAWAGFNGCLVNNDTIHDNTDYTHINWRDCNCASELNLYLTHDGGHSWPGGNATFIGDSVSTVIHSNDLMWAFFQQYSLSCNTTNTENINATKSHLLIYPNPFNKATMIQFNRTIYNAEIIVFNVLGQKVKTISKISGNKTTIHRDNLPGGPYFICLIQENRIIAMKKLFITD